MRAVVLRKPYTLELLEIPEPVLTEPEHVLIQVKACGICGSDLRYWAGENPWAQHTLGRHVDNPPNMILGHEFSGVVVKVNSAQYEHLLGQRVGAQAFRTCGRCALCKSGRENLCQSTVHIGHAQGWGQRAFYPGAYADYCLAWADLLYPMVPQVTFEEEAMRDFLGVAVHAFHRVPFQPGDRVLCIGGGPVGLSLAQVARAHGARQVFVSEIAPVARTVVEQYPGIVCLDPTEVDLAEEVGRASCQVVFDTVGTQETITQGLELLALGGTYVNLAVHDFTLQLNAMILGAERAMTTSSNARYRDEREAHELIASGAVDMSTMITHRLPLEAYQEAYELLLSHPKQAYKVVFILDGSPSGR